MFRIVCERLRVVAAFSEGRGEGCVWRASKDLIFFFSTHVWIFHRFVHPLPEIAIFDISGLGSEHIIIMMKRKEKRAKDKSLEENGKHHHPQQAEGGPEQGPHANKAVYRL